MTAARIMLVDDDADLTAVLSVLLTFEGYLTSSSANEEEAFNLITHQPPDLLVLDLQLDDPDGGLRLLRRLQLHRSTMRLPVLICSGDQFWLDRLHRLTATPQYAYLRKPFLIEELLAQIDELLARNRH
ncbi:MAG TPA: response regulator [Roseiflexaceae bacterium]|nr:response regulator [Roseiflexaceae bacterium]